MIKFGTRRPLLLLDVDGPLNPWPRITRKGHTAGDAYVKHLLRPRGWHDERKPALPVLLSADHGAALRTLGETFTLVWATTWMEDANRLLSPLLGLPDDLPVIEWPEEALLHARREGRNGSWKTPWIAYWLRDHAPEVPWVWLDDEVNRYDRAWFGQWYLTHPPVEHLLIRIESHVGLVEADFDRIRDFGHALA